MTIGPNNINRSIWYIKHGPWQGHKNEDAFWLILFGFILLFGSNYYWKEEPDFLKVFFYCKIANPSDSSKITG